MAGAQTRRRRAKTTMPRPAMISAVPPASRGHEVVPVLASAVAAGRSTALKSLEDLGYEAVDNLPLSLLPNLLSVPSPPPLAIGIDVRTRDFGAVPTVHARH